MEGILNLSKNRKWKTYKHGRGKKAPEYTDMYFVYDLSKEERGKYLNTWFLGDQMVHKKGYVIRDEVVTLKRVDEDTLNCLYQREYNPVSIFVLQPTGAAFKYNDKNERLYPMKAMIHSIDDSSFGIWWEEEHTFEELCAIRIELMKWINTKPIINGSEFLKQCVKLGADSETIDYN